MHLYRFVIRDDHREEDETLASSHIQRLKNDKDYMGAVGKKTDRFGHIWLIHCTPEELVTFTEYEKT